MLRGTLRDQRDWYQDKANDPLIPKNQRSMWQALADELTRRLDDGQPDENQMELF